MLCDERSQNERGDILRNNLEKKKQFGGERKGKERKKIEKENKISAWERRKREKGKRIELAMHSLISCVPTVGSR